MRNGTIFVSMKIKTVVVANWKMNPKTLGEAKKLYRATKKTAGKTRGLVVVVTPPVVFLHVLAKGKRGKNIVFAVQNAHSEIGGAYTGEVSFAQAKDAGATYAIIGHAERRATGETNDDVRKKVATALETSVTPIICIGENQRSESGEHFGVVKEQIHAAYTNVPQKKVGATIVAYEPVWAVGGDAAMKPHDMQEMAIFIRKCVAEIYAPTNLSVFPTILYGGAIDAGNAAAMLKDGDVDGFLVGRASADIKKVTALFDALR